MNKSIKALVKEIVLGVAYLYALGEIDSDEFVTILHHAALMIPESIKQWNTTYTLNLFEDWTITDFNLWYKHTFKEDLLEEDLL